MVKTVILATTLVKIVSSNGATATARALLDSGSDSTLISENLVQRLGLSRERARVQVRGVGGDVTHNFRFKTNFTLHSTNDLNFSVDVSGYILPKLTSLLPSREVVDWEKVTSCGLELADPYFWQPSQVDLILSAEVYSYVLRSGFARIPQTQLTAQCTAFGWVISGVVNAPLQDQEEQVITTFHCTSDADNLDVTRRKFWEIEEVPESYPFMSAEEEWCERQFHETHRHLQDGRYSVSLPFKQRVTAAQGDNFPAALITLKSMERRFKKHPVLERQYKEFLEEYEHLRHMSLIPTPAKDDPGWYLPHHGVMSTTSLASKLRVVFDAAKRNFQGHSLNDFLFPGPALQQDLMLMIASWRNYPFVFTTDIVKMYRQILVHEQDRYVQQILWRTSPTEEPRTYQLNTVTYGINSSPYLAIRSLHQIAHDGQTNFPLGAECIIKESFVDDFATGGHSISEALEKRRQLHQLLSSAGLTLSKWSANDKMLLQDIDDDKQDKPQDLAQPVKTLGLMWNPQDDVFLYRNRTEDAEPEPITKRHLASQIAKHFDPLGWISPVIIVAKIQLQDLWLMKINWDDPVSVDMRERWLKFKHSLNELKNIQIPRWTGFMKGDISFKLHAFCDASQRAYATCVYLRPVLPNQHAASPVLLAAKTKLAPLKVITIPRLELCGAHLLVKLLRAIKKIPGFKSLPITAWSDSQVTPA